MSATESNDEAEKFKSKGNDKFKEKKYVEAIEHYSEAIKLNPENAVYYSNRSACYASINQWQLALDDAVICVAKDSKFMKGYYRLVTSQIELNMFDDALASIKVGEAIEPNNEQFSKLRKLLVTRKQAFSSTIAKKGVRQLDEAQKKEYIELQDQLATFQKEMRSVQIRLSNAQRDSRANSATLGHINSLPADIITYRTVGKAFLKAPKPDIETRLNSEQVGLTKLQKDLQDKKEYLDRRISSVTSNIKDLTVGA